METKQWKWKTKDGLEMYSQTWLPAGETRGADCLLHGVGEPIDQYQPDGEALAKQVSSWQAFTSEASPGGKAAGEQPVARGVPCGSRPVPGLCCLALSLTDVFSVRL